MYKADSFISLRSQWQTVVLNIAVFYEYYDFVIEMFIDAKIVVETLKRVFQTMMK